MAGRALRATLEALLLWSWFGALAAWTGERHPLPAVGALPLVYLSAVVHHTLGRERFSPGQGRWLSLGAAVVLLLGFFLLMPRQGSVPLIGAGLIVLAWWRGAVAGTTLIHPWTLEEAGQRGFVLLMALVVAEALAGRPPVASGALFLLAWLVLFAVARVTEASRSPRRTRALAAAGAATGIAAVCGLVTLLVIPSLWRGVLAALGQGVQAVFMVLGWAGAGVLWLAARFLRPDTSARVPTSHGPLHLPRPPRAVHLIHVHLSPQVRGVLGASLTAVILLALLAFLWRSYRRTQDTAAGEVEETREALGPPPRPASPPRERPRDDSPLEGGAVGRVRRAYRAFLALEARRGRPRRPSETPGEYARHMEGLGPARAVLDLTRLYERARYGRSATEDSARAAEAALKQLEGERHD